MALQDDLRAQLIKQFEADVIIAVESDGTEAYVCPTCKRHLARSDKKCPSCDQALKWDNVRRVENEKFEEKTATITVKVPGDFVKGDCRKCPFSYIGRHEGDNIYACPLNMRNDCPLEIQ